MDNDKSLIFWMKKLQSLLGILPVGVFLFVHFSINSFADNGADAYTQGILFIRSLPLLPIIETIGIFIPLLLHALIGFVIIYSVKVNIVRYPYLANFNFTLQRISGLFLFIFIAYHVWHLKFSHPEHELLTAQIVFEKITSSPAMIVFYLLGVLASTFHLLNGLYNFAIKWGITYGANARKWWAWICLAMGIIFTGWGVHIWWVVLTKIG